jgi:integrase
VKRNRFGQDLPPLLPEVYRAMLELRATYNEAQEASGLIFPAEDGRHHYRTLLAKPFKDILEHAAISKRFTPHGCRRTGAKLYGKTAGTRMAMEIAGHLTERMHEHYAGGAEPAQKLAAARAALVDCE